MKKKGLRQVLTKKKHELKSNMQDTCLMGGFTQYNKLQKLLDVRLRTLKDVSIIGINKHAAQSQRNTHKMPYSKRSRPVSP